MVYITGIVDTDLYLTKFLPIKEIASVAKVNLSMYRIISMTDLYQEILQLDNGRNIRKQSYRKGLLAVLKNYHNRGHRFDHYIDYAYEWYQITTLDWLYDNGFRWRPSNKVLENIITCREKILINWLNNHGYSIGI